MYPMWKGDRATYEGCEYAPIARMPQKTTTLVTQGGIFYWVPAQRTTRPELKYLPTTTKSMPTMTERPLKESFKMLTQFREKFLTSQQQWLRHSNKKNRYDPNPKNFFRSQPKKFMDDSPQYKVEEKKHPNERNDSTNTERNNTTIVRSSGPVDRENTWTTKSHPPKERMPFYRHLVRSVGSDG